MCMADIEIRFDLKIRKLKKVVAIITAVLDKA